MKPLELVETEGTKIVRLYLEKLELLNEKERAVLIDSINLLNKPVFVADSFNNV